MKRTMTSAVRIVVFAVAVGLAPASLLFPAAIGAGDRAAFDHNHTLLDSVLQKHVDNGLVDYRALLQDRTELHQYLAVIAGVEWDEYVAWSRQQKLALWINAYNALTIEAILRNYPIGKPNLLSFYPVNSIRHIDGVWDKLKWTVAGRPFSLDHIEHEILRKEIREPRVHFVLVCASIGCPLLESRAYSADTIGQRLDKAADNYINRDRKVILDTGKRIVWFPMIFKWFGEDFIDGYKENGLFEGRTPKQKGLLHFIYTFATSEEKEMLRNNRFAIRYLNYDWSLNEQP